MRRRADPRGLRFSPPELRDLVVAWLALGLAFAIFFARGGPGFVQLFSRGGPAAVFRLVAVSLLTAGVGFLLHELAHKVVAVHYGQLAEFRADYSMLFLAVMSALLGFLFAAPGAVHHRGRISARHHGIVALAGPAVNVALAAGFVAVWLVGAATSLGVVAEIGAKGLGVNLFLAAFNLVPVGSLDGATVKDWSVAVWAVAFLPTAAVAFVVVFLLGIGF